MVLKKDRKGILARQYPSASESKKLGINEKPVRLDSRVIRKLRGNRKMTIKDFKKRFGIK